MTSQAIIFISLGFIAASLLAVLLSKQLFSRAYKKAVKDLRGQIPLNQAEMDAEHDRLRAEFAVNLNKLEYKVAAMQQSELSLRIEATQANEHKLQTTNSLNNYIKKSVRWETAHDSAQNAINILKNKLKIQDSQIIDMQAVQAQHQVEQKTFKQAQLNYQISDAKYAKAKEDLSVAQKQLADSQRQFEEITKQHNLQDIELSAAQKNNVVYEAKISEISTQVLFLSQELFAKKINLDLSEKTIDKYKNKLLTQKLQMRDASLANKAIYAVKSKLDGTANLNLEPEIITEKAPAKPSLASINTANIVQPKLIHNANKTKLKNKPNSITGLRGRMNSMLNSTGTEV